MASYYLYETQAEKLRGLKTPATKELARAVERYLAGEFTSCLAFTDKNTENLTKIPKSRVSVNHRFAAVDDALMRKILACHWQIPDPRLKALEAALKRAEKDVDELMRHYTKRKYVMA